MKKDIHPKFNKCVVKCACGNTFETISTLESITVEICSACHPFYTGQRKFVDTEGRIDVFKKRMEKAEAKKTTEDTKKVTKIKKAKKEVQSNEKTLKEILAEVRQNQPKEVSQKKVIREDKIEEKAAKEDK
jgi:large subunit ribosomal protein L31